MSKSADFLISEKYDHQDANYYHLLQLDYYELDAFNQPDDPSVAFHIQNDTKNKCRYCGSQFLSNNKLHNYLQKSCKSCHTSFVHSIGTSLVIIAYSKKKENLQFVAFQDIPVVYLFINPSTDIGTGYNFRGYHYLKGRVVLSLSSLSDTLYFDTGCSVTLYDSFFFQVQASNITIQKMAIPITVRGLGANKHAIDQYAISDIYIPANNSQGQLVTAYI